MKLSNFFAFTLLFFPTIFAHPDHMKCSTPLAVGTEIMGYPAVSKNTQFLSLTLTTERDCVVPCGGNYTDNSTITVTFASGGARLLEAVGGGKFIDSGSARSCDGTRTDINGAKFVPTLGVGNVVTIRGGYQQTNGAVQIPNDCVVTAVQAQTNFTPCNTTHNGNSNGNGIENER